jgi:putative tryptophan/tyrosine transport system substrate-binding protein
VIELILQGLNNAGFVDGTNLIIEHRWANENFQQLPALAADLVSRNVQVMVTIGGTVPAQAAKSATTDIPIVVAIGSDPVKNGLSHQPESPRR